MRKWKYGILTTLLLSLANCTTIATSNPPRTATEEMLISSAAERAAAKLSLQLPANANVFVDNTNFEGTDSKYAIATIRTVLLLHHVKLVDDKKHADVIVETRAGALSMDRKSFLIGIPAFNVPIPLASAPLPFPEIALYGSDDQKGVAKFAITGYNAKEGALVSAQEPQYGFSHNTKKTLLIFISWTKSDYMPEGLEDDKAEDPTKKEKPHVGINGNGYTPNTQTASAPAVASAPVTIPNVIR